MKGGQPALFVSDHSSAEFNGDFIAVTIPTGDTALKLAMTRNAALCLMATLGGAMDDAFARPKDLAVIFPTTARVAKVSEL